MPETNTSQQSAITDPRSVEPKPDPQQEKIPHPGSTEDMHMKPDHGEESYEGLGRLTDRTAIITGADSGIGRATALCVCAGGR